MSIPPTVEMKEVESSNIVSIGYDEQPRDLYVKFANGGVYRYQGVDALAHRSLMEAESKGAYLAKHIKKAYDFQRVV